MSVADLLAGPAERPMKGPRCALAAMPAADQEAIRDALARGWTQRQIAERLFAAGLDIGADTIGRHFVLHACRCGR